MVPKHTVASGGLDMIGLFARALDDQAWGGRVPTFSSLAGDGTRDC